MALDEESFDMAVARQKPFAVINRFPLLKQIHREAVLPIMKKLATPRETATSQPTTTQRAVPRDPDRGG